MEEERKSRGCVRVWLVGNRKEEEEEQVGQICPTRRRKKKLGEKGERVGPMGVESKEGKKRRRKWEVRPGLLDPRPDPRQPQKIPAFLPLFPSKFLVIFYPPSLINITIAS